MPKVVSDFQLGTIYMVNSQITGRKLRPFFLIEFELFKILTSTRAVFYCLETEANKPKVMGSILVWIVLIYF